jgi:hypothetical protein
MRRLLPGADLLDNPVVPGLGTFHEGNMVLPVIIVSMISRYKSIPVDFMDSAIAARHRASAWGGMFPSTGI